MTFSFQDTDCRWYQNVIGVWSGYRPSKDRRQWDAQHDGNEQCQMLEIRQWERLSSFRWPHREETKEVWSGDRGHQSAWRTMGTSHSTTDGHLPRNVLELCRAKTIASASQLQAAPVQQFAQFHNSVGDRGHKATSPTIRAHAEDFLLTIADDMMIILCPEMTTVCI
jgi:hypothetical protein